MPILKPEPIRSAEVAITNNNIQLVFTIIKIQFTPAKAPIVLTKDSEIDIKDAAIYAIFS